MLVKKFWQICGLSLLIGAGGVLNAAADDDYKKPDTAQLSLRLTVAEGCSFADEGSGNTIVFNQVTLLDNPKQQQGSFNLNCTGGYKGKTINITLDGGEFGDPVNDRKLYYSGSKAGPTLAFQVYFKDGKTIWGDGTNGSQTMPITPVGDVTKVTGTGTFVVELLKQKLDGKIVGTYSNKLTMTIQYPAD